MPQLPGIKPIAGWGQVGVLVAGYLAREAFHHLIASFYGLQYVRFCAPVASDGFEISSTLNNCYTGQAGFGYPMAELGRRLANMYRGQPVYFRFMGFSGLSSGQARYSEQMTYVAPAVAGGVTKERPFFTWVPPYWLAYPSALSPALPPGRVIGQVRPWPVWRHARPMPQAFNPSPTAAPPEEIGADTSRGRKWEWAMPGAPPIVRPIPDNPAIPRVPPRPNEQETKLGSNTPAGQMFLALLRAREGVSEMMDMVRVLFRSLPRATQKRFGGKNASDANMISALIENWAMIDGALFLKNLIANQLEDEIIGRSYMQGRAEQLKASKAIGGAGGPIKNPFFEDYAKQVSQLSDATANMLMQGGGSYDDLSYDQQRSLGQMYDRANAALKRWLDSLGKSAATRSRGNPAPGN